MSNRPTQDPVNYRIERLSLRGPHLAATMDRPRRDAPSDTPRFHVTGHDCAGRDHGVSADADVRHYYHIGAKPDVFLDDDLPARMALLIDRQRVVPEDVITRPQDNVGSNQGVVAN